jgi:hypothetical protein
MGFPLLAALRVIPWASILAGAPAIARAADTLLTGAKARTGPLASATDLRALADRVVALERHDHADAEVLKQMSDQMAALTTAAEVLAGRVRWLTALAVGAVVVAAAAVVVAVAS